MLHPADAWVICRRIESRHVARKGAKCDLRDRESVADAMTDCAVGLYTLWVWRSGGYM